MTSPGTTSRLRDLLDRLEDARARLEAAEGSEQAVDVLQELAELAKETQATIERARREGPATGAGDSPA
jgi:hypothetical protein